MFIQYTSLGEKIKFNEMLMNKEFQRMQKIDQQKEDEQTCLNFYLKS